MQTFKAALRVVLSHPGYLLVYIGFLSCMGVFVTNGVVASEADDGQYAAAEASLAVVDRDGSMLSEGLTAFLSGRGEVVEVDDEPFALQDAVATGEVDYLLIVPEDYGVDLLEAARTGSEEPRMECVYSFGTLAGALVDEQVNQYVGLVRAAAALEPDASEASVLARADEAASAEADLDVVQTPASAAADSQFAFYLQWGTYTMTAVIVVCVGLIMAAFNRTDLHRRNLVSPMGSLRLGLQEAAACLAVAAFVWVVVCGIGLAAFGSSLAGVPAGAVALSLACAFVFALAPLSVGFLLGQLGAGETAMNAAGNIVGLVTAFLGGAWVDLGLVSPEMQALSRFVPTSWYTEAVSASLRLTDTSAASVVPVLGNLGMVALFAMALFAVALAAGRVRMRSSEAGGNAAASATAA